MNSIRNNLLLWLLSGLLVAGFAAGVATFLKSQEEVGEMFDYQLQQMAYSMKYSARFMDTQIKAMMSNGDEDNDFVIQVWDTKGHLLHSSLPSVRLDLAGKTGFLDVKVSGEDWRVFNLVSAERIIQVAQPRSARAEVSLDMAMRMLLPLAVLIPVLALLVWLAVKKSLLPLRGITSEVEQRDASLMTPLRIDSAPAEVRPLLIALNDLLMRLGYAISSQRQFVADAAHELRTPLTALSLQADLVEQAESPSERAETLEILRSGIRRSSQLVNQLLILARHEPEVQRKFERLDLASLVKQVVDDFLPLAEFRRIDLQAGADLPVVIAGDKDGLRTVISNLVDNAIRYMHGEGRVDVSVSKDAGSAILRVSDTGPGIPEPDRERVFERFYRIPGNDELGSGLGLSIVKQIIDRHKASIAITEGKEGVGTDVVIRFHLP